MTTRSDGDDGWSPPTGVRATLVVMAAVAVVAFAVLWPDPAAASAIVRGVRDVLVDLGVPRAEVRGRRVETVLNVVMVVPLALALSIAFPRLRWSSWVALGFLTFSGVEAFQGVALPDRTAEAVDVVTNTTGAAIGALIGVLVRALRRRSAAS